MPNLYTPENTPVVLAGTRGDVKVKDENGNEIQLKKGDRIPADAFISIGPQGGKIVFQLDDQTLKFENSGSGEVSLINALAQSSDASQDTDIGTDVETAAQITTTPETATQQRSAQQPMARPAQKEEAPPVPTPFRQGVSEAPEVVKAERGEEPCKTATEVVARMAENIVQNSTRAATPITGMHTQVARMAESVVQNSTRTTAPMAGIQIQVPREVEENRLVEEDALVILDGDSEPSEPFTVTVNSAPPVLTFDSLVADADDQLATFRKDTSVSDTTAPDLPFKSVDIQVDQYMPATPTDITVDNIVLVNDTPCLSSQTFTVTGKTAAGMTGATAFLNIDDTRTPSVPVDAEGNFLVTCTTTATDLLSFTAQVMNSANTESAESEPVVLKLDLDSPTIREFANPDQPETIKVFDPVNITVRMSEPVNVTGIPRCQLQAGSTRLEAPFNADLSVKTPAGTYTGLVFSLIAPEGIKADSLKVPANPLLVNADNSIKDPVGHEVDSSAFAGATLENYNFDTVVVLNPPAILRILEDTGVTSEDGITNSKKFLLVGTADPDETVYVFAGDGKSYSEKYAEAVATEAGQWQVLFSPATDDATVVFTAEVRFGDKREVSEPFTVTHDALAPLVTDIAAETSEGYLAAGATLPITVNFDSDVYPEGALSLGLSLDSGTVLVPVTVTGPEPVKSLTASYTVAENAVTESGLKPVKLVIDADASITDLAGNPVQTDLSALPAIARNIDATPPHISVDLEPGWVTSSKSPVIPITTKAFSRVTLTVANKPYEQIADATGSCKVKVSGPLATGLQDYSVVAVDRANVSTETLTGSFTVNPGGPALDVVQDDLTSQGEATEEHKEGQQTAQVVAQDIYDNEATPIAFDYEPDFTAPDITVPDTLMSAASRFSLYGTSDDDTGTVAYQLDGGAKQTSAIEGGAWSIDFTGLKEGSHNLELYTIDNPGNHGTPITRTLTVEFKAPPLELTRVPGVTSDQQPVWEGKTTPGAKLTATPDGQEQQDIEVDDNGFFTYSPAQPLTDSTTPCKVEFVSTDKNHEHEARLTDSVTIDRTGPEITITDGLTVDGLTVDGLTVDGLTVEGAETLLQGTCSNDTKSVTVKTVTVDGKETSFDAVVNSTEGIWVYHLSGITEQIQTIVITSEDNLGNKGTELRETLNFPQQLPLTLVKEPGRTVLEQPEWKGTTKVASSTIKVVVGTLGEGTVTTDANGDFVFKPDFKLTEIEGGHKVRITAEADGYKPAEAEARDVVLDISAPTISVDEFKPVTANAMITGTSTEELGKVYIRLGVDGKVYSADVKDFKWELQLQGLQETSCELFYKGEDDLGNAGTEFKSLTFNVAFDKPELKLSETPDDKSSDTTPTWKGQFVANGELQAVLDGKQAVPVSVEQDGTFTFVPDEQLVGKHTVVFTGTVPDKDGMATIESEFEVIPAPIVISGPALTLDSGLVADKSTTLLSGKFPEQNGKVKFVVKGEHIYSTMYIPVKDGTWKVELVDLIKQTASIEITALDNDRNPLPDFEKSQIHELQVTGDAPDSNIQAITGLKNAAGYGQAIVIQSEDCEGHCKPENIDPWSARVETSFQKAGKLGLFLQNRHGEYRKAFANKIDLQSDNSAEVSQNLATKTNGNLKFDFYDESLMHGQWVFKPKGMLYLEKGYIAVAIPSVHYSFDHLVAGQFGSLTLPYHAAIEGSIPQVPGIIAGGAELGAGSLDIPHFKDLFSGSFSLCFALKTTGSAASAEGPYPALTGYMDIDRDSSQVRNNYAVGAINDKGRIGLQAGSDTLFSDKVVADGRWHNVCITRHVENDAAGSTCTILVDGKVENTSYFTHGIAEGLQITACKLNTIGGTVHADGSPMDYFKGTIDNLKGFSYALTEAEAAKQAPLLAHVYWHCPEDHCAYEGEHHAGLVIRDMLGSQLDDSSTLYFQVKSTNHDELVTDFTVTFQGGVLDPVDAENRVYEVNGISKANLQELLINPDNPLEPYGPGVKNKFGFQLDVDTNQDQLETNPDAIIRFNRGEYPFGTGISFGIGKEQTATPAHGDEFLTQQTIFLPTEKDSHIHDYDGTRDSISLDGLKEMQAFFENASHQDDTLASLMSKTSDHEYQLKHPCTLQEGDACSDPLLHVDTVADNKQIVLLLDDHLVNVIV